MPGVPAAGDQQLARQLGQLFNTVRGMASQQQDTISNLNGQPILNVGLSPGSSPAQYGLQMVNPSTGAEVAFFGEDANGKASLKFRDASGTVRVVVGQLPSGDYGLQVLDPSGNGREILPAYTDFKEFNPGGTVFTTTSTVASVPTGAPSVNAYFGASGDAIITVSATMWVSAGNGCAVDLFIDGSQVGSYDVLQTSSIDNVPGSARIQLSKFPGASTVTANTQHAVTVGFRVLQSAITGSFQGVGLTVEPI